MTLTEEQGGRLSPESRAAVLAEVLNFMATKIEPVPYGAELRHVMQHFDAKEELVSIHVMGATLELCVAGFLKSNTYHSAPEQHEQWLMLQAETTVSPSRSLTRFTYGRVE